MILDAEPLPRQRTDDDDKQGDKKQVHTMPLAFWLCATDEWPDEQAGGQPRRRYPQHAELQVPGTSDAVGQPPGQRDAVEAVALDTVMSAPGRLVDAAHEVQKKRAANCRDLSGSLCAPWGMAYPTLPLLKTSV